MNKPATFFGQLFKDKDGAPVVLEVPNVPLMGWILFSLMGPLLADGQLKTIVHFLGVASIIIWALLELNSGRSYFRRALGLVVLILSIYNVVV